MQIPLDYQLFVALVIGVIVAVTAAFKFISDMRKPASPVPDHIRVLGAALSDQSALAMIADELREMRELMQRRFDIGQHDRHRTDAWMEAEIERRVAERVRRIVDQRKRRSHPDTPVMG